MPYVETNNAQLFLASEGDGAPLLMISGMMSDMASWTPLLPQLSKRFHLLTFDNRGSGRTTSKNHIWNIDDMVGDAIAVLDHYQIPRAHIVGHSLGGMIGLRLVANHPERVGAFISMSSLNAPNEKGISNFKELAKTYRSDMPKQIWFEKLFHNLYSPEFFADAANVKAATDAAANYIYLQTPQNFSSQVAALASIKPIDLKQIKTPILSLIGQNDKMVLPHKTRQTLAGLPNVTFKTIANAAHSIHWEAPKEVSEAITDFLKIHAF